jgi:hypothetical protein
MVFGLAKGFAGNRLALTKSTMQFVIAVASIFEPQHRTELSVETTFITTTFFQRIP